MGKKTISSRNIFWLIITFMFASFCIFYNYSWGKYVLIICAAIIFAFGYVPKNGIQKVNIGPFHLFLLGFILYCCANAIWAWNSNVVFVKSFTLLQILLCYSLLYFYYDKEPNIDSLLDCVRWGGYAVAIYSFFSYGGFDGITAVISSGERLDNTFNNVNTIAMLCAMSCILEFHRFLYRGLKFSVVFTIPCIIMMATLQSRKAIIMLVIGIIAIAILKNFDTKRLAKSIFRSFGILIIVSVLLWFLLSMDIFEGVRERLLGAIGQSNTVEHSALLREKYIDLGLKQFLKSPIGGIGIDCSQFLTSSHGYASTYLHNNFVELLACGGILGFISYYAIHIYLVFNLLKYYKYDKARNIVCLTLLVILLVIDYAMVSYYDKASYFYYMIFFLQVKKIKKAKTKALSEEVC